MQLNKKMENRLKKLMEYHETTKIDSYENYNEGNPNAHPRENR